MNIHEYQAKQLFKQAGIDIAPFYIAHSVNEALEKISTLDTDKYVVKAQVHAGGRGKAGGIKLVKSKEELKKAAEAILGMTLVNEQTGPEGKLVSKIMVTPATDFKHEYYLSLALDNEKGAIVVIASREGGMDIEQVSEKTPELIKKVWLDPYLGMTDYIAAQIANDIEIPSANIRSFVEICHILYKLFVAKDCSLIEINPLALTVDDKIEIIDAKVNFDDNAVLKHKDIAELRDSAEEDPRELEASQNELNYVSLDGNIGCMVNGAGLAMATMDAIYLLGGKPANFMDVGGGATAARVEKAVLLILSEPRVEGIIINIFGGVTSCKAIAEGTVSAIKKIGKTVPFVMRLDGTEVEEGMQILKDSGLVFEFVDSITEGVPVMLRLVDEVKN